MSERPGNCLTCGASVSGQSHCEECTADNDLIHCEECGYVFDREQCAGWNEYYQIYDCYNHLTLIELRAECEKLKGILRAERRKRVDLEYKLHRR